MQILLIINKVHIKIKFEIPTCYSNQDGSNLIQCRGKPHGSRRGSTHRGSWHTELGQIGSPLSQRLSLNPGHNWLE